MMVANAFWFGLIFFEISAIFVFKFMVRLHDGRENHFLASFIV